jgi:hypothetical protein
MNILIILGVIGLLLLTLVTVCCVIMAGKYDDQTDELMYSSNKGKPNE